MFIVKKCGKTDFGYWAYGTLLYDGFEINDIFSVNKELQAENEYQPKKVVLKRTKNGNLKFKLEI